MTRFQTPVVEEVQNKTAQSIDLATANKTTETLRCLGDMLEALQRLEEQPLQKDYDNAHKDQEAASGRKNYYL